MIKCSKIRRKGVWCSMELWPEVLNEIRKKLSKPSFETWLANTSAEIDGDVIIVKANNSFAADWLTTRYKLLIFETVKDVTGRTFEIEVIGENEQFATKPLPSQKERERSPDHEWKILIEEQNKLIMKLQEKMEELEKRIDDLEGTEKQSISK